VSVVNPGSLQILFTDPGGRKMLGVAAVLMVIGMLAIRKITTIRI
jgi:tight adherence protein B